MFRAMRPLTLMVCAALALSAAGQVEAATYGFLGISANNVNDVATGQAQLSVEVVDAGGGQVDFIFRNAGPLASSITDVYFEDGTLLGIAAVINGSGVDFSQGASPGDLPDGNNVSPPFEATAGFTADSTSPAQPNGVNPNEVLTIRFDLINGKTFADTLAALDGGTDLRIGIHVQGFAGGGSEAFVNGPPRGGSQIPGVPEPASLAIWSLGLALAGVGARRMRKKVA